MRRVHGEVEECSRVSPRPPPPTPKGNYFLVFRLGMKHTKVSHSAVGLIVQTCPIQIVPFFNHCFPLLWLVVLTCPPRPRTFAVNQNRRAPSYDTNPGFHSPLF